MGSYRLLAARASTCNKSYYLIIIAGYFGGASVLIHVMNYWGIFNGIYLFFATEETVY